MGQARLRAKNGNDFANQVSINMKLNTWNQDKNTYLICKDDNDFPHACIVLNTYSPRYKKKTAYEFFLESGANQIAIRAGLTIEERANDDNRLLNVTTPRGYVVFTNNTNQGVNMTLLSQVMDEPGDFVFMLPARPSPDNVLMYYAKPALEWDNEIASWHLHTCVQGVGASSYYEMLKNTVTGLTPVFKR